MQITIVPDDWAVIVNGMEHRVDCSSMDSDIHAVQWSGDRGSIEYKNIDGVRKPNLEISDMTPFQPILELWNVEHAKPPPLPPHLRPEAQVAQSFAANKTRKADKLLGKGDVVGAVKLLFNRR